MIETKRLMIRKGLEIDLDDVMEFRNTDFVLKYNAMNVGERSQVLQEISNSLVLYEKNLKKVIGIISIHQDDLRYGVKSVCLSYYLGERYSRQGYMSEALQRIIDELFNIGCDLVSARVFEGNIASVNLLKKLGFEHEGTLRHAVRGYGGIIYNDLLFSKLK